jgi:hypothetical protein
MVYRGVVARIAVLEGAAIVGEELRFIPLQREDSMMAPGKLRLRITRSKAGGMEPEVRERQLDEYDGQLVAAMASGHDDRWLYGCSDISGHQP